LNQQRNALDTVTGLAAIGCGIVGVAALIVAVFAFANAQFAGAGLSLIPAALAFGQLMNVTLKR
jgi:hypothetical protein